MKPTEIKPLDPVGTWDRLHRDRLTSLLIWVAFFLIAGLTALITDLWLWPMSDGPVAEAVGLTTPVLGLTPPSSPTAKPTASVSIPTPAAAREIALPAPITPSPCIPPDDWGIYTVQAGNTLFSLARRYGVDVEALMRVNCLNANTIFVGQRLYVPGPLATATNPAATIPAHLPPTSTPRPAASATPSGAMVAGSTPPPTVGARPALPIQTPAHYLNIVLLGSDKRPGGGAWRTDSMIIVSVDMVNNVIRLLSIPRDLWVYIPGWGHNRINTADLWGELAQKGTGPEWVKQTIYHNLGIPIHHYVRVDFQGFMKVIDTVGGIDVDVECPLPDINLAAGMHHMDGQQALRYARSRYSTNDFDRGRRQRKVLMALWEQALTLDIIPRLPELWWTMANSFQTDLSLEQVINLAYVGVQLEPQRILSRSIGPGQVQSWVTPEGAAVLLPRQEELRAMLESFYAPVDIGRLDALDRVRVRVLNGSPRGDADQMAAAALRWAGFTVSGTGPAEHRTYAATQIEVYTGDIAAAQQVAQHLGVPVTAIQDLTGIQGQPDPANPVSIQVILGQDYTPCQR